MFPALTGLEVVGPQTIRFILNRPDPDFIPALASNWASVVGPSGVSTDSPAGSGNLVAEKDGDSHVLKPRPDSASTAPVLTLLVESDPAARYEALVSGRAHMLLAPSPAEVEAARQDPRLEVSEFPSLTILYLAFNTRREAAGRLELRQAAAMAVDRFGLQMALRDHPMKPLSGPLPPGLWGRSENRSPFGYDPPAAVLLLEKITPPEMPLVLLVPPNPAWAMAAAEEIKTQLGRVGIEVAPSGLDDQAYRNALATGEYDLTLGAFTPVTVSPFDYLSVLFASGGRNAAAYANPKIDQLLAAAGRELDKDKRLRLLTEVQDIVAEEVPYVFLGREMRPVVHAAGLRGLALHPVYPVIIDPAALVIEEPEQAAPALPEKESRDLPSAWPTP